MNFLNDVDGLKSLLGVQSQPPDAQTSKDSLSSAISAALTADQATVSSAGSEVAHAASLSDVRADKVAEVQSALAAGTYSVPASAVASKVVDVLLNNSTSSR
jgi:negative regulator of flagellin synthesis FlgM